MIHTITCTELKAANAKEYYGEVQCAAWNLLLALLFLGLISGSTYDKCLDIMLVKC